MKRKNQTQFGLYYEQRHGKTIFSLKAMVKRETLAVLGLLVLHSFAYGQAPPVEWIKIFGYQWYDYGNSVCQTADGGFAIVGSTTKFTGFDGAYLMKTDSLGDSLWERNIGVDTLCGANDICLAEDGGYLIVGSARELGLGMNLFIVKSDYDGNVQWQKLYGGSGLETAVSVRPTPDGNYIVAGNTSSFGPGTYANVYLLKINPYGDTLWTKVYGGVDADCATSVKVIPEGGYIISGYTSSYGAGFTDVYLIKTDSLGDTIWTRTFGGSGYESGSDVDVCSDSGYIIAGYSTSFGGQDAWLVRTDKDGGEIWSRTYGGGDYDRARSIVVTSDGGFTAAGWSYSFGPGDEKSFFAFKTNGDGDTMWTLVIGDTWPEEANTIRHTADGGYIIVGWKYTYAKSYDIMLVKLGPDPTGFRNIYSPENRSTGIGQLFLVSSNPCHEAVEILCTVTKSSSFMLCVHDASGRSVATLKNGYISAGEYRFTWNTKAVSNGAYFVTARTEDGAAARKVLLIR